MSNTLDNVGQRYPDDNTDDEIHDPFGDLGYVSKGRTIPKPTEPTELGPEVKKKASGRDGTGRQERGRLPAAPKVVEPDKLLLKVAVDVARKKLHPKTEVDTGLPQSPPISTELPTLREPAPQLPDGYDPRPPIVRQHEERLWREIKNKVDGDNAFNARVIEEGLDPGFRHDGQ